MSYGADTPQDRPPAASSLLEAYGRWKALQERPPGATRWERTLSAGVAKAASEGTARQIAALANAAEIEREAHRKGVARVAKVAGRGAHPSAALASGYARYRHHGGSASLAVWRRRLAQGDAK